VRFHRRFVEILGFALDDLQGVLGAFADAGAQAVAQVVGNHFGLAVDDLQGPFGAGDHAVAASVAAFFIDFNDLSGYFHGYHFLLYCSFMGSQQIQCSVVIQVVFSGLLPCRFRSATSPR
jgi:hypothetical protein